jgi:hypothetical protein
MTPVASSCVAGERFLIPADRMPSRPDEEACDGTGLASIGAVDRSGARRVDHIDPGRDFRRADRNSLVGVVAGNTIGLTLTEWVNFLAGFGAILLTFLASGIDEDLRSGLGSKADLQNRVEQEIFP